MDISNLIPAVEVVNDLTHLRLGSDSKEEVVAMRKAFQHESDVTVDSLIRQKVG